MKSRSPKVPRKLEALIAGPPTIGWREWVSLPDLDVPNIKAKVDTGARTSTLHAYDLRLVKRHGRTLARFVIHPLQRDLSQTIEAEAEVVEMRAVRDSGGTQTLRPVIQTKLELFGRLVDIELTLAARDQMGFRMLLGREALRGRFLVDAGRSFLATQRKKSLVKQRTKSSQ